MSHALTPAEQLARNWFTLALHDARMALAACQQAGHAPVGVLGPLRAAIGQLERAEPLVEAGVGAINVVTCHGSVR